jgi:hypothetical protein
MAGRTSAPADGANGQHTGQHKSAT